MTNEWDMARAAATAAAIDMDMDIIDMDINANDGGLHRSSCTYYLICGLLM